MKLEPLFNVKENNLFLISDNSQANLSDFEKIEIKWSQVELQEEVYNEEYLASLRDQLKAFDEAGKFAILVPVIDKDFSTPEQIEAFTNAVNHTARRVKDCISVAGIVLPSALVKNGILEGSDVETFTKVLAKKHAQYVYFIKKSDITDFNLAENVTKTAFVIY